ncbi:sigma-70 family RNA polymerase sigma factor [Neobacillus notoginsengisoli]|uniref:Sigma-70 family RNA polymerase sigma factor n=1 Tax=Neobacillus notoginsengisoli TaxID=1578198 RepID=A0A417YYU8_9BACI|nr:sigma-70 family RNA polymerase sigma factor [Neobacillus notoginsengisoli]RHW43103.1 sigma-70 family RNA polymerase sigma factor [Neobacillus notoginsengisoli]
MPASKNPPALKCEQPEPELEQKHFDSLRKYCRFLTKNDWESEDLFQSAVLKGLQNYAPADISPALLKKIAYHQWIDMARKAKREIVGFPEETVQLDSSSVEGRLDAVKLLLERTTPKQAVIFLLKEGFNYQAKEIAELLTMTETSVKSLLHRAKGRLENERRLHSVDAEWQEEERQLLSELMVEALLEDDPAVLISNVHRIHSLVKVTKLALPNHSGTPLGYRCMAA